MKFNQLMKATSVIAAGAAIVAVMQFSSMKLQAKTQAAVDDEAKLVAIGLRILPDFIDARGKDPNLVGLGSYIVNAQADCNGCHTSDAANEYLPT